MRKKYPIDLREWARIENTSEYHTSVRQTKSVKSVGRERDHTSIANSDKVSLIFERQNQ